MLDVGWGDLIDYLGDDPYTKCIVIYMESIGDARSFLSASREVALTKPIIVIKAGRTAAAAHAAASHTGSLSGSDEVLDAAFRRVGVLRVDSISQVFDMAEVLAKQPRPRGPRLAIVTNAGGPGVLATDALIENHGELASLSPTTLESLNSFLPAAWSHGNPMDILGDADPQRYARTLEVVARDPAIDGLLAILTPQAMTDPTAIAQALSQSAKVAASRSWPAGWEAKLWNLENEFSTRLVSPRLPIPIPPHKLLPPCGGRSITFNPCTKPRSCRPAVQAPPERANQARAIIAAARSEARTVLTEAESKQILAAYGIPTVETHIATTEVQAIAAAQAIGFPVVLKLHSKTITHKTDVGGVQLNLANEDAVGRAYRAIESAVSQTTGAEHFQGVTVQPMVKLDGYELIVGCSLDPQFGPVLLFGTGGQLVEVFKDRSLGLPPLNTTLARRIMEQTRIITALKGVRGRRPVDLAALEQLLVRFSYLIVEQPWIKELDINPLLASPDRLLALDARVIVHGLDVAALLRDGSLRTLDLFHINGVLTFPSFHAASAALYIWGLWPMRWLRPLNLLVNGAMIAATPIGGGHFLVDVLGGVAVAASIYAARWSGANLAIRGHGKALTLKESFN